MYIRDALASSSDAGPSGTGYRETAGAANASTESSSRGRNPRLDGHQLLVLTDLARNPEFQPGSPWRRRVAEAHPGLRLVVHDQDTWRDRTFPADLDWAGSTMLLSGAVFPEPAQAPRLEYIQLQSAGADPINQKPIFKETDVAVCTTNGVHGPQIAEWVIGTFLALNHQIPHFLDLQKEGKWKQEWPNSGMEDGVKQRVLRQHRPAGSPRRQVAGHGRRGLHEPPAPHARLAARHGLHRAGHGDADGAFPSAWYSGTTDAEVDAFLSAGLDWLVVAVPLTASTRGLVSEARLRLLADRARARGARVQPFVTNIARGTVVDTDALIKALDEGWVRGAALDVTDPEPLPEGHPLWARRNLIITPHVSAMSNSLGHRIADVLELNLGRFAEGEKLVNQVSRKEGY
ncbi:hypothetical protein PG999_007286 [Apiospora kogelbergensis]|uniref:D-isomer specific 2-hydroxyacid dehydrogenase NAD-binding domain-containing protein n=1 Tax=Apiospora kogelbergensis TaxID=1337665 RepID=A0AAW0QXW4_9PEZI